MGKIQELSISREHWALDNPYVSLDLKTQFLSERDIDSVDQQIIILEDNIHGTTIPKFTNKSDLNFLRNYNDIKVTVFSPEFKKSKVYTQNTKTWKGVITKLDEEKFSCRLFDLDDESEIYETAEFNINSIITDEDKPLLEVGAIFYWSVGSIIRNGTKKNQSEIRLRRVAAMDSDEFDEFYDKSKSNYLDLKWD